MSEEVVKVALGDDYYKGAYFNTVDGFLDYEVPRSQLKRWEAAAAAYKAMQDEIECVMQEQRDRVFALAMERRKDKPSSMPPAIQKAYEEVMLRMLKQQPLLRKEQPE